MAPFDVVAVLLLIFYFAIVLVEGETCYLSGVLSGDVGVGVLLFCVTC